VFLETRKREKEKERCVARGGVHTQEEIGKIWSERDAEGVRYSFVDIIEKVKKRSDQLSCVTQPSHCKHT